ncbi:MAG: DUF3574 domain-containing protein [Gammaproteobacteria bacterium]|nr:DUF3574 domain-containing protein [Gammaproteobacteria bacterium]
MGLFAPYLLISISALAVACATPFVTQPLVSCESGDSVMIRDVLFFGRYRPGGEVSDDEWRQFLDEVITPRFPTGVTVMDARGQWQTMNGVIEREPSLVVILIHAGDESSRRKIQEISAVYRRDFEQEAVLRERSHTCVRY